MAEEVRIKIEQANFANQKKQPNGNLTASIGFATYSDLKQEPQELLNAADLALYQAKKSGKNIVRRFEEKKE